MWDYDLAKAMKEAGRKSSLEKDHYKGTYKSGQIILYGGRIKFDLNRCNMTRSVRYQIKQDPQTKLISEVPRQWNDGDQCWCLLNSRGSVLIVGMV